MKSVGQQLREARLAKNWTPELAARETKIKADRVRDLEADDYTNFSSPTYARGFVRTYARALGLDEYRMLRQLDNKLPEDDNATFAPDNGSMPYVPEPSTQALHVSSAPRTGLYVVLGLGCAVVAVIGFVLLQAYRAGELQRYFASTASADTSSLNSAATAAPDAETPPHAVAVDPNDTTHSARALPVDLNALPPAPVALPATPNGTPVAAAPATSGGPGTAADVSVPIAPPAGSAPSVADAKAPEPVSPSTMEARPGADSAGGAPQPVAEGVPAASTEGQTATKPADASTPANGEKPPPRALPVDPSELVAANQAAPPTEGPINPADASENVGQQAPVPTTRVDLSSGSSPVAVPVDAPPKNLVLTATGDSAIRVTSLDHSSSKEILYDSVLRSGQSIEFEGRKFSVQVAVPSAVGIMLDGVNYGPHSEGGTPETFTLESRQP